MRLAVLFGAFCIAGALATPLDKRVYKTEITVITVTEYMTLGQISATKTSAAPLEAVVAVLTTTSDASASSQPPPAPPATTLATTAATATTSTINAYQSAVLFNHNIHRSNHSANSLTWSTDLENSAAVLANRCYYQHDTSINGGGYGQNIGFGVSAADIGVMITNLMYNDEMENFAGLYGEATPNMTDFAHWGHFTQIVWKATTQVGCVTVTCDTLGGSGYNGPLPFTVCNYSPQATFPLNMPATSANLWVNPIIPLRASGLLVEHGS